MMLLSFCFCLECWTWINFCTGKTDQIKCNYLVLSFFFSLLSYILLLVPSYLYISILRRIKRYNVLPVTSGTLLILATQEAEIRRIPVQSQHRQTVPMTLSWKYPIQKRAGRVTYVVEHLVSMKLWVQTSVPPKKGKNTKWLMVIFHAHNLYIG
jgi:putative copper export protein